MEEKDRDPEYGGPEESPFPFLSFLDSGERLNLSGIVVAGQHDVEACFFYPFNDVSRAGHGPVEFYFCAVERQ